MELSFGTQKYIDAYHMKKNAPIYMKEFGYYTLERWAAEGHIPSVENGTEEAEAYIAELFEFDEPACFKLGGLGWCEAGFEPVFETKILEDLGEYELVQDFAGRGVLYFKGRRNGFMPEYKDHPVKDMKSWEELCKWRMDPATPARYGAPFEEKMLKAKQAQAQGKMITMDMVGGYMYLRSLMGPEEILYAFYDNPQLIEDCMQTWFDLADSVITKYQEHVEIDELFLAEDICYNMGMLISPVMVRDFLFPYYEKLYANIKARNRSERRVFFQVDTDGNCIEAIKLYSEIGVDVFSPFEVASGSDVVEIGKQFPNLVMSGGIDKRIMAEGGKLLDEHIDAILPAMKARGGYIPTCDHGVPEEVSFENYSHFRKRLLEFAK